MSGAYGHDDQGRTPLRARNRAHWGRALESDDLPALQRSAPARRGHDRRGRPARRRHRQAHRSLAEGQVRRARARVGGSDLVGGRQRRHLRGALRRPARQGDGRDRRRRRPLRRRRLRRRRPEAADRRPRRHELPLPRALRADDVHRPDRGGAARVRAAGARPARTRSRVRPRDRRDAQRHLRRPAPVAPGGADRRHLLRRRDQEVDLHVDERPSPARRRLPDALLRERRRGRRRRDLLRPLRHGQDDALGRPGAVADRRRRARLGRRRRLQLRGRLLREGDQPLRGGRARDLQDDAHLRDDPRERRPRRARRRRPRRRLEDREHPRRLQARADRERAAGEARRAPEVA